MPYPSNQFNFLSTAKWSLMMLLLCAFAFASSAKDWDMHPPVTSETKARELYEATQKTWQANPKSAETSVLFARACFDLGEFITHKSTKADLAKEGIAAAEASLAIEPKSAHARFYLGMNHGQLARTKTLGALAEVKHIESNLLKGIEIDETFQNACNHLYIGILYKNAPGWPASVGSRKKARHHFERAVALAPNYPYNHLRLIEALIEWNDDNDATKAYATFKRMLPELRQIYSGEEWNAIWKQWDQRLSNIEKDLN